MPCRRSTRSFRGWVANGLLMSSASLVNGWFFLVKLSPVVAVHDDDCLSAPVKPAFWFVLAEEVCPSPDEIEGVGDFVLCKFNEQFSETLVVG